VNHFQCHGNCFAIGVPRKFGRRENLRRRISIPEQVQRLFAIGVPAILFIMRARRAVQIANELGVFLQTALVFSDEFLPFNL
jgi:hypothetical protein